MARYYPKGSGTNRTPKKDDPNPVLDPGIDEGRDFEHNSLTEWLYADDWSEEKLHQFRVMYATPGLKDYIDYLLDLRYDQEYMRRYNLDYSDIHDPRKLKSVPSGSRALYGGLNFVSDMAKHLYK